MITKKDILKDYIKENGGATLDYKGDFMELKKGYIVSTPQNEYKTDDLDNAINKMMIYLDYIKKDSNLYVGCWYDNGTYYIDINIYIMNKKEALKVGKNNQQKAMFDIAKNDSIYLDYNIKFYTLYEVIKDDDNNIIDYKPIKQFDKLEDVKKEFKKSYDYIRHLISDNYILNDRYILKSDIINIKEI